MTQNRVVEIRRAILSALEAVYSEVYFEDAPDDAQFPYLVFDLPDSVDNGKLENFELELTGWDALDNGDTYALENMMDIADRALNRKTFVVGNLAMMIYRDGRRTIRDKEKRIRQRQYTYQVRVYGE